MIKLKDFVDVNLTSITPTSEEENKTVVYIYGGANSLDWDLNATNYTSFLSQLDEKAQAFVSQFFALGGASLKVYRCGVSVPSAGSEAQGCKANNLVYRNAVKNLPMEQVAVVLRASETTDIETDYDPYGYYYEYVEESTTTSFELLLKVISDAVTEKGSAFRKLLVRNYPAPTGGYTDVLIKALKQDNNLIWKLCNDEEDLASVLAYFSKVTIINPDTLRDYCFVEEKTCEDMTSYLVNVSWEEVKKFVNFDMKLLADDSIINLGGNTSAGYDIIQEFESVYISQRIIANCFNLLKQGLNLSNAKPLIHSAIIDVMEVYYNIGYLIQAQYTGSNIYKNVNGKNICILANGEVLTGGYKVIILPKASGSDIHALPDVELIISTNKGIRSIKVIGLVL